MKTKTDRSKKRRANKAIDGAWRLVDALAAEADRKPQDPAFVALVEQQQRAWLRWLRRALT